MKQCNNNPMLLSFTHKYFPYTLTYMIVLLEYHRITSRAVHVKLAIGINTKVVDVLHYMKGEQLLLCFNAIRYQVVSLLLSLLQVSNQISCSIVVKKQYSTIQ